MIEKAIFLQKPFSRDSLVRRIGEAFEAKAITQPVPEKTRR
jgi:hypothetical protein